jgi:hypothetical protein
VVSKKYLLELIREQNKKIKELEEIVLDYRASCDRDAEINDKRTSQTFNALVALNKKINAVSKNEGKEENDKINEWLTDDRVEEIQPYLHKGVK